SGLTHASQRKTLVVLLGLILAPQEPRQVRQDQGLSLAPEYVANPDVAAVRMGGTPVESGDGRCQRLACLLLTSLTVLGHRQDKTGSGSHHQGRLPLHHADRTRKPALAILA